MNFYFQKLGFIVKQDPVIVHYAMLLHKHIQLCLIGGDRGHPVTLYNLLFSKKFWTNWTILRIKIKMLKIYLFLSELNKKR